jgi:hypothetical protein
LGIVAFRGLVRLGTLVWTVVAVVVVVVVEPGREGRKHRVLHREEDDGVGVESQ